MRSSYRCVGLAVLSLGLFGLAGCAEENDKAVTSDSAGKTTAEKVQGRFVRQTGGSGQYGDVTINLYPQEPGAGYEFTDKIVGGKIPKEYIPAVNAGIQEALGSGVIAGYPIVDVRVELVDGSYHDVDSSERAFKIAGSMAFKEAVKRAKPKLLEPVMSVEVTTPEEYLGDVIGNLNSRRGRIESMAPVGNASGNLSPHSTTIPPSARQSS